VGVGMDGDEEIARSLLAKLVRSRRGTKWSPSRESTAFTLSRSSTRRATRRVTSSTRSFSCRPAGRPRPGRDRRARRRARSGAAALPRRDVRARGRSRASAGSRGRARRVGQRGRLDLAGTASKTTFKMASAPARSSRACSMNHRRFPRCARRPTGRTGGYAPPCRRSPRRARSTGPTSRARGA